jgi:hypothetical protein
LRRRREELQWFVRGVDAGGDDPIEFGAEGEKRLEGLAKGSGYLQAYSNRWDASGPPMPRSFGKNVAFCWNSWPQSKPHR